MPVKTKKILMLPAIALMILGMASLSALVSPASSVSALTAKQCQDKYGGKEIKGNLSDQLKKDKCAISQGGPCGGTFSGGKGYFSCPVTSAADAFCKKKYPGNAARRNACRSGYFSSIAGCATYSGDLKKACDVGKKEFEKVKEENESEPEDDGGDDTISNPIAGDGCAGVKTAVIKCSESGSGDVAQNGVWALLIIVLNILTAGVGIVAVGGIVYGAVLYTTAEDKADQVKKATDIITNVVIGLVAFALMWAGLNFIVPGGIFN